jgi:hypothetical protein
MFFRLDTVRSIKAGPVETRHEKYEGFADKFDRNLWGVSTGGDYSVDHVELTLHIEDNEGYIIDRLEREKRHGHIEPIDSHTYKFIADVYAAGELLTWARSFIGRVVRFESNDRLAVRYKLKRKERNDQMELHNRLRLDYTRRQGPWRQLQSTLQLHALDRSGRGWSASQRIRFRKGPGRLSALVSYFHTPDYQTRLFQYEPLLTNMFRYPSLYGHGVRFVAAGLFALWQGRLRLEMLYGLTRYFDRQTQSSGMEEIRSPWKQDISVQLRLKI